MAPAQKVRRRLTFSEHKIELAHVDKIRLAESAPISGPEIAHKVIHQVRAILCPILAILLILYYVPSCAPIRTHESGIDVTGYAGSSGGHARRQGRQIRITPGLWPHTPPVTRPRP